MGGRLKGAEYHAARLADRADQCADAAEQDDRGLSGAARAGTGGDRGGAGDTHRCAGWRQRFIWPRTGRLSGLFGAQRIYQGTAGAYHGGVDVAGATGATVVAPAAGVVILAADRPYTLEGHLLMIDHGHGLNSAFLHLSRIDVKVGDAVAQGQRIGAIGATGRATGPHLHWG